MKKFFIFSLLVLSVNFVFCQSDYIDLQGVFNGKYRYEKLKSLCWRPGTQQYTYYDEVSDAVKAVDLKNGKESTLFRFQQLYEETTGKSFPNKEMFNKAGENVLPHGNGSIKTRSSFTQFFPTKELHM